MGLCFLLPPTWDAPADWAHLIPGSISTCHLTPCAPGTSFFRVEGGNWGQVQ